LKAGGKNAKRLKRLQPPTATTGSGKGWMKIERKKTLASFLERLFSKDRSRKKDFELRRK